MLRVSLVSRETVIALATFVENRGFFNRRTFRKRLKDNEVEIARGKFLWPESSHPSYRGATLAVSLGRSNPFCSSLTEKILHVLTGSSFYWPLSNMLLSRSTLTPTPVLLMLLKIELRIRLNSGKFVITVLDSSCSSSVDFCRGLR